MSAQQCVFSVANRLLKVILPLLALIRQRMCVITNFHSQTTTDGHRLIIKVCVYTPYGTVEFFVCKNNHSLYIGRAGSC